MKKVIAILCVAAIATIAAVSCKKDKKVDHSTPEATVKTFYKAMIAGDTDTAMDCINWETEDAKASAKEMYNNKTSDEDYNPVVEYKILPATYATENDIQVATVKAWRKYKDKTENSQDHKLTIVDGDWLMAPSAK